MIQKGLTELTDQELLVEAKKTKQNNIGHALIIGILIGIAVYSSVKNGFGLFSFLPLVYIPVATKNNARNKELNNLLKERGLK